MVRHHLPLTCLALLALSGCRAPAPPPASETPPPAHPVVLPEFLWLDAPSGPYREAALALLKSDPSDPVHAGLRQRFLTQYFSAYRVVRGSSSVEDVLRLWDMHRVARQEGLSAACVRGWLALQGKQRPEPLTLKSSGVEGLRVLGRPKSPRGLLSWALNVVEVDRLTRLSPELRSCLGTTEPISATVFIRAHEEVTDRPWPEWYRTALLIHEAAHVQWYWQTAGQEARLLRSLPDERQAFVAMYRSVRDHAAKSGDPLAAEEARRLRTAVTKGNELMGLPPNDLSRGKPSHLPDGPVLDTALQESYHSAVPEALLWPGR